MSFQFSVGLRDAMAAAIQPAVGAAPVLELRSGVLPNNTSEADNGIVLASLSLPSTWLLSPTNGGVSKAGTWEDLSADAAGTLSYWRLRKGGVVYAQGDITLAGGSGSMTVNTLTTSVGQIVTVTNFSFTVGGM